MNQWEYSRKELRNNPKVILDDVLTKILNLKTLSREEFNEETQDFDYLCSAIGTGGTLSGISKYAEEHCRCF